MFNIVEKRKLFFTISGIIMAICVGLMLYATVTAGQPFRLDIDFQGGSIYEVQFDGPGATESGIREVFQSFGEDNPVIQQLGDADEYRWSIRGSFEEGQSSQGLLDALEQLAPLADENENVEQVSPTIGREVTRAAILAVAVAAVVITGFIVIAFRQVPKALRYGLCAIAAMIHDLIVVLGAMAFFSLTLGWEVDTLFLTAVLTVVGFSVQDSIVMFDRIRENIPKHIGEPYETIVNRSIWETIHRSLATQLNAFFIMIAILLFGGESIQQFISILFIGLLSGTYSSIFVAVPLLVAWEKGELPLIHGDEELSVTPVARTS